MRVAGIRCRHIAPAASAIYDSAVRSAWKSLTHVLWFIIRNRKAKKQERREGDEAHPERIASKYSPHRITIKVSIATNEDGRGIIISVILEHLC